MHDDDCYLYVEKIYLEFHLNISKYIVLKCDNTNDVQDILQNIFLCFLNRVNKSGVRHVLFPKQYLLRIARDELSKFYKEKALKNNIFGKSTNSFIDDDSFDDSQYEYFLNEDIFDDKLLLDGIWETINRFDEIDKKIFILRFIYDNRLEDIANELNLPLSSVKNKLYRGTKKIRQDFKEV